MATYQVRTLEEADQIIREHERKTKTKYALLRSTKNFGCIDVPACSNDENEVRFETVGVPYCGVPFFVAGLKILQCQSFKGRTYRKKKEIKIELTGSGAGVISVAGDDTGGAFNIPSPKGPIKKKKKSGRSTKVGCTATIIMKEVIYYPQFKLFEHTKNCRIAVARQLKDMLKAKAPVQKDRIIYVTVPATSDHFGHAVGLNSARKIFVKNDVFGYTEPGSSKHVYYPVKREKLNLVHFTKKVKVDEDDVEVRAKEVREMLQSIMGLTYKHIATPDIYRELYKDLLQAKEKFQHSLASLYNNRSDYSQTPQISVQASPEKAEDIATVVASPAWQPRVHQSVSSPSPAFSGTTTFVAVTPMMPVVSSSVSSASASGAATVQQTPVTSHGNDSSNHQETSIFIEAMEAIFNSQM